MDSFSGKKCPPPLHTLSHVGARVPKVPKVPWVSVQIWTSHRRVSRRSRTCHGFPAAVIISASTSR